MKQVLAVAAVVAVVLVVAAAPAGAGATKGPTLRSLQAQITALKKQVTTLKKRVVRDETFIDISLAYSVCSTAVTADTFQDTWTSLDGVFTGHSWAAYFGAQTAVNDYQACAALQIVRAHNQRPANSNVLRSLLDLFKPSSSATAQQGFLGLPRQPGFSFGRLFVFQR
jgi:hypothetical protein